MSPLKTFACCAVCLGFVFPIDKSVGQENSDLPQDSTAARIAQLIEQLGASQFAQREAASSELLKIGIPAIAHLRSVTSDDDEMRYRSQVIAQELEDVRFAELAKSFLLDSDPTQSYGLPTWDEFSLIAGTSRTSKLLFLDMLREQPELVAKVAEASRSAASMEDLRTATIERAASLAEQRLRLTPPEIGDLIAILFATSHLEGTAPIEVSQLLEMSAFALPVTTHMNRRGYGTTLRRLYDQWLPKTHDAIALKAMEIALRYDLRSGAVVARKQLSPNLDVVTRGYAIYCITRFGDRSDIPSMLALIDDTQECLLFSQAGDRNMNWMDEIGESDEAPPGVERTAKPQEESESMKWQVRINDIAMAAAVLLSGNEPSLIFEGFERHEFFGFDSRSVAVRLDAGAKAERQELFESWRASFESQNHGG